MTNDKEKIVQCNCEDSAGNTTIRCCNDCGLPIEAFWQPLMDFKKFSLLEDAPTVATDNTLPPTKDVIKFLLGEGALNGVWYGDPRPDNEKGNFWWRKYLREYSSTQRQQARNEAIQECIEFIKDWYEKEGFEGKNFYEELEKLKNNP